MLQVLLKIVLGLGAKLVTEKLLVSVVLILLEKLVQSTKNDLDDKVLAEVKKALG